MAGDHLLSEPATDPLALYRYRDGIAAVDLLAAGVAHLDFFTLLADHPSTFAAICGRFEIHPRPADVMLTRKIAKERPRPKSSTPPAAQLPSGPPVPSREPPRASS